MLSQKKQQCFCMWFIEIHWIKTFIGEPLMWTSCDASSFELCVLSTDGALPLLLLFSAFIWENSQMF